MVGLEAEDTDPRVQRQFKNYLNSLGIKGVKVNNIYTDLYNGIILLKVLDAVEPGCVEWKKVRTKLSGKKKDTFDIINNCNECIQIGKKKLGFTLLNCKEEALRTKEKRLTVAYLWQLIRYHSKKAAGGLDEKQLIKWANKLVDDKSLKIKKLDSKSLVNCDFYFALIQKVFDSIAGGGERMTINEDLIEKGKETLFLLSRRLQKGEL